MSTNNRFKKAPFTSKSKKSTTSKSSLKNANAVAGYAKRHESKAKRQLDTNLYEYVPDRAPKTRGSLNVSREEEEGVVGREEGEGEGRDERLVKLQQRVAGEADGVVDSEDDEDLDSDAAFEGESDEERFSGFKFSLKSQKTEKAKTRSKAVHFEDGAGSSSREHHTSKSKDMDDPGEEEGEEEGSDEEMEDGFVDLSTMLDGNANDEDSEGEQSDSSAASHETADELGVSDKEELDGDALDQLGNFVTSLETKKRKADDSQPKGPVAKRRLLADRTEAGPESEFSAGLAASHKGKLQLDDLLAPLLANGTSTPSLASLKKSAKLLASSSSKNRPLQAPLPQRAQDRLDREAAYEQTKEEVEKWAPTMKRIREAEHLSFPLQAPPVTTASTSELTSRFVPTNELESSIDKLLRTANMLEESSIAKTETLKMKDLSIEDVSARRAELRQMRELLFRAEVKAKRVSKIKSKTHRRLLRKEKEKNKLTLEQIAELDPEAAEVERMKMEVGRAKERATMRHKNTGKWAKEVLKRGGEMDRSQRAEINEQLERGEVLKRKIREFGEGGSENESSDDGDGDGEDMDADGIKKRAFDELAVLKAGADDGDDEGVSSKRKGLFEMKFMREGMARDQRKVDALVDDFEAELGMVGDDAGEEVHTGRTNAEMVQGNPGRMVYRPVAPQNTSRQQAAAAAADSDSTLKSSDHNAPLSLSATIRSSDTHSPTSSPIDTTHSPFSTSRESNPWLIPRPEASSSAKRSRANNEIVVSKDSSSASKSKNMLKKQMKKTKEAREVERDDAVVEISFDSPLGVKPSSALANGASKSKESASTPKISVVDPAFADSDNDGSDTEEPIRSGKGITAFQQRELVALAFAGDNVVQDFTEQKRREIEADAPREEDTTLAGWGSWGGLGSRKRAPNPRLLKKIPGIDPSKRADFGKSHIIISEKRDKKASKYLVKDLPYPYTSHAQFEKSMEMPIGVEWNTRVGFQRGTKPKVVKKMGTIINPVQKLF